MPSTFFPYVTAVRNVFLDGGDSYQGSADVAVNAGYLNGANLADAKHGIYYAWSPYRDAMSRYRDHSRLAMAAKGTREVQPGVHLGQQALVFDEIGRIAGTGDYRDFAKLADRAMKEWGVLAEDTGYVDGKLISDTGELVFDPEHSQFSIHTPYCACFSGVPKAEIALSHKISVRAKNERISLTLLAVGETKLGEAREYVLTAMGTTGLTETTFGPGPDMMGMPFTAVDMKGKLYAETLEGTLSVKAEKALLRILNPVGEVLAQLEGEKAGDKIRFVLDGQVPGVQYHLTIQA